MLKCHSRLAFSKTNWYISALKVIVPIKARPSSYSQSRCSATLLETSALNTLLPEPILPRLEPLNSYKVNKVDIQLPSIFTPTDLRRRCSGFKKLDGKQCTRIVVLERTNNCDMTAPVYCHQHDPQRKYAKQIKFSTQKNDITHVKTGKKVYSNTIDLSLREPMTQEKSEKLHDCWDLWINPYLKKETQALIKQEITKPISSNDRPGYIYAYVLDEGPRASHKDYAYFKIGRTNNPHRRMYQVTKSCNFVPKIIELFPSFPSSRDKMSTNLETLDGTTMDELPKCPISHRIERLILLELESSYKKGGFKCSECGTTHREWFKISRTKSSTMQHMSDQELFESYIRPIILRWIKYGVIASALRKN